VGEDPANTGLYFEYWNAGKRSVTLDLRTAGGRALFESLVPTADAIVESDPPHLLAQGSYDYPRLAALNPGLVLTSVSGFGTDGPYARFRGSNLVYYALSGFMASSGEPERPPVVLSGLLTCVCSSVHAAAGTLMAILARDRTGRGQEVRVSAQQAMVAFTTIAGVPHYLDTGTAPKRRGAHGLYPCQDGYVIIAIGRPEQWQVFSRWVAETTGNRAILDPKLQGRPEEREPYADQISVWLTEFSMRYRREELFREAQRRHLTLAPVYTVRDLLANEHLAARAFFQTIRHPRYGPVRYPGPPYKFSGSPVAIRGAAPEPGRDNVAILCGELGLSRQELAALRAAGVI
jgi:crotonobetainyl-CoA:carnitine CoA-transferase CaiB-like acyl-CoA transferase